ncbi:Major facilitator superfamily domain general substrate transporter [Penicillium cosmopolitanum]|uniref:Major facilitator superfamily domain general substrate transporter n=1 Tax=Penicillium cosmopolitanum TaxID=1131564 RepID=A0A9W9VFP9_9EURO|nr:Major facilitator superfamily domain general substrate transporter [Penicillium cosmopolitanum]KAJ5379119.1 Major facilitator superfamily domain general substrate transporter [Penicillium cosmopolitanum]
MSQNEPQNLPERPSETTSLLPHSQFNSDNPINPRIIAGIIATWIATFLAAADSTITSTLSATIAAEFDSLSIISWLGSGYLIGLTATQPLSGKLSDIFGRRASFCTAASLFTIGNLACGFARSKIPLICARVITGIGGGGCIAIATFIASDNIPLHRRGTWQGFSAVVYTTGMGLGAVIGGAINDAVGWRWAFIGIAPISLVSVVGVAMFVPKGEHVSSKGFRKLLLRVDFAGSVTLVSALVLLLVGLNHEGEQIVTRQFIIAVPLGILFLVIFLLSEARWAREPIIPLSLFRQRTVVASCLTAWFLSMAFYALTFYVPLYMKQLGYSTSEIGVRLLPDSIGAGLGSFLVGLVIRMTGKYGIFRYTMPLLVVIAAAGFYWISMETPWVLPEIYLFFKGFGMGGALTMLILALLHVVPHEKHATATSALYAFRSTGSTMGLSAASAVVYSRLGQSSGGVSACAETDECYMHAIRGAFELALGCAFAGLVSALFIANYETRPKRAVVRDVDN